MNFSIIIQATVDHLRRFRDVLIGMPGRCHDANVFTWSHQYHEGQEAVPSPYCILGDSAYPIFPWLLVPYKEHTDQRHEERLFNEVLAGQRVVVEHAFGGLQGRFPMLGSGVRVREKNFRRFFRIIRSAMIL